uniref:GST N-terminal domain-containing protein n=1 Tax=Noctiluca scintillans TaxID=2966 RepID=A0A7S1AHU4_NOCSC|mmetsp:Transcript_45352/g.120271  ORF Transcript_45352/g.120271 Transcript_45352/m.120271 type:complete len:522 (+) Transcript_45352:72-1637(+)
MRVTTLANRVACGLLDLSVLPRLFLATIVSVLRRDGNALLVLTYVRGLQGHVGSAKAELSRPPAGTLRLFAWELSYFSGKVRAYLRYKKRFSNLTFDEVVATPSIVKDVLVRSTQSATVPQLQLPDGRFVQDSTEILDEVELLYPVSPVLPALDHPRQRLTCQLLEFLGDEWLLVPAFHWRWAYSGDGSRGQLMPHTGGARPPNHRQWNELQWGNFLLPKAHDEVKVKAAQWFFRNILFTRRGVKNSIKLLGVTWHTVGAWEASCKHFLEAFEAHLQCHDFVLGGRPSTADFGLLGPLFAHLYRDPVPGQMMRSECPLVVKWVERLHHRGGEPLIGENIEGDAEDWLPDDKVPDTVLPMLQIFFTEMWPVLKSTCRVLTDYLRSGDHDGGALPGKSFGPGCADQRGWGPLQHAFSLPFRSDGVPGGRSHGTRMVMPYHIWMLQRLERTVMSTPDRHLLGEFLRLIGGKELLQLSSMLDGCRVVKRKGLIFPEGSTPPASLAPRLLVLGAVALALSLARHRI